MIVKRWSVLSPSECLRLSAVRVVSDKTPPYLHVVDGSDEMWMNESAGTMYDSKMGPRYEGDTCGTCRGTFKTCKLGHFGLMQMGTSVFVNNYLTQVMQYVRLVCRNCRLANKECSPACVPYKSVSHASKNGTLMVDGEEWTASETREVLARCEFPGRPEHMIFDSVMVLPNCSRPIQVIKTSGTVKIRDENGFVLQTRTAPVIKILRPHRFTEPYLKIMKLVIRRQNLGSEREKRYVDKDLYEAVNTLLMNSKTGRVGTTQSGTREEDVTGVLSSIVKKRGLIRNNLMGKRVDFSARGVAAGDPTLRVDEFGIPRVWRSKLTIPVRVFANNLSQLKECVEAGEWMTILKKGGELQYDSDVVPRAHWTKLAETLECGDVVDRWLRDGDPVILIRQPTLHKGSMMCGKVRLHDRHTVEMNVNVTTPYNGDFDGDEFNVFVPRSETARAEFEELFAVKWHIVNENGHCQIYPIQNAVLGMYRASLSGLPIPRVGRGLCTKEACRERIRQIWFDEGPDAAVEAIQEVSDFANDWLDRHGASLGMNEFECAALRAPKASDGALLRKTKLQAGVVTSNLLRSESRKAFNEASVFLNSTKPYDQSLRHMRLSKCKGDATNELNVALVLGEQFVSDAAPRPFFGTHILPCGLKKGFIPTGYVRGLQPEHTALHQMSGRYGVYTKSVGVKVSGQRYREMAQCMENLVVSPGGSVLDECGNVVQLVYGEDGLDPKFVRPGGLPSHALGEGEGEEEEEEVPESVREMSLKSRVFFGDRKTAPVRVIRDWMRALVPYGQAVGIIAAQSIGEPATQELLNKIHSGEKNQKKSNMPRLFKPGKNGEICGTWVQDEPIPPTPLAWSTTRDRPKDTEWTRRYEAHEPFPKADEYMILFFDREVDLMTALRMLPNRRSMHPALDTPEDGRLEVHVALVDGSTSESVMRAFFPTTKSSSWTVRKSGKELTCSGDFRAIVNQPWITNAYSDDACATAKVLGIEAARAMLVREFTKTFQQSVDVRHVMLMVDAMTYTGHVRSMDFFGYRAGAGASVLGRACFSDAIKVFVGSAAEGHVENGRKQNVTESVVTGSMGVLGTGGVRMDVDTDALLRWAAPDVSETFVQAEAEIEFPGSPAFCPPSPGPLGYGMGFAAYYDPFAPPEEEGPGYVPASDDDEEPLYRPSTPTTQPPAKRPRLWDEAV